MAAGRAIVSTAVDGCREVCADGETGLLVPPATRPRSPRPSSACSMTRRCGTRSGRARAWRRGSTTSQACVESMQEFYDESAGGGAERCALGRLGAQRTRGLGGAARPAAGPLSGVRHDRRALARGEVPVFVFHEPRARVVRRKLDHLARERLRDPLGRRVRGVLRGTRPGAREGGGAHLRRRPRQRLERGGSPDAAVRHEGGRVPGPGARCLLRGLPPASRRSGRDGEALMSWEEIDALARAGLFDFQSHTLAPRARPHGPALAGFMTPELAARLRRLRSPLVRRGGRDLLGAEVPLGTPLFRSAPRPSEDLRFYEDEACAAACVDPVADGGRRGLLPASRLGQALRRARCGERRQRAARDAGGAGGRHPTRARGRESRDRGAHRQAGRPSLLSLARCGADGARGWRARSATGRRFAARSPGVPITLPGGDLRAIARLGEDYVELLPGAGPRDLAAVLRRKWSRRFGGAPG